MLADEIQRVLKPELCKPGDYEKFLERIKNRDLTIQENPTDHVTIFFQPYNPKTKEVFIVHHKKSGK